MTTTPGAPIFFDLAMTRSVRLEPDDGIRGIAVVVDAGGNFYEGFIEEKNGITYLKIRTLLSEGGIGKTWINKLGDGVKLSSLQHLSLGLGIDGQDLIVVCVGYDAAVQAPSRIPYHNYRGRIQGAIIQPWIPIDNLLIRRAER